MCIAHVHIYPWMLRANLVTIETVGSGLENALATPKTIGVFSEPLSQCSDGFCFYAVRWGSDKKSSVHVTVW